MRLAVFAALLGVAACGSPTLQAPSALAVVNLTPTDGAVDVPVDAQQSVCFSAPVKSGDATPANLWVADASGAKADGLAVVAASDPHCLAVSHAALKPASGYTLHVQAGIHAADGTAALPVAVDAHFTTRSAP